MPGKRQIPNIMLLSKYYYLHSNLDLMHIKYSKYYIKMKYKITISLTEKHNLHKMPRDSTFSVLCSYRMSKAQEVKFYCTL